MRNRVLKSLTVVAASAAGLLLAGAPASAAPIPWSVSHGTATADGTRWLEPGSSLVVKGELRNTGPGCYSLWSVTVRDFVPGPVRKLATQCGSGSQPVETKISYALTTTSYVQICQDESRTNCGRQTSVTQWPAQRG
ncbi:hypothetical protein [Streptomyces avidinii]|uniref:Secreted protein n=1 Tax=Streptomyces avidinii TaxID=1895 RepID=A0ABS4LHA9_STRAV|nr:hypothetical protein [Streptomyces avidinii]MBP2041498.1 hypothetical protein [Streptomyces avidinii]GGZ34566.1 hypothetical protein GCM10010343_72510 [Streptomyces avidinii]